MRALLVVVLLVGCKQAKEVPTSAELVTKVRALAAKVCSCKDRACTQAFLGEWNTLTAGAGGKGSLAGVELKTEDVETLIAEDERVRKCVAAFSSPP